MLNRSIVEAADERSLFQVEADCLVAPDQQHARVLLLGGVVDMIVDLQTRVLDAVVGLARASCGILRIKMCQITTS